jgi:hypothetical protein
MRALVAVSTEPGRIEPAQVPVAEDHLERPVLGASGGYRDVVGDRDRVEQPLTARMATLRTWAVVSQPDGVVDAALTVGPPESDACAVAGHLHNKV